MSENSAIEWTDATWNPLLGCTKVSAGCMSCYAILEAWKKMHHPHPAVRAAYEGLVVKLPDGSLNWTGRVNVIPERLEIPLRWKRPKRIFVNSMSDLFHEAVSEGQIAQIFGTMARADSHIFQVLTKRPERMSKLLNGVGLRQHIEDVSGRSWPLPNVWLGTSTEDQRTADERIPHLLRTPAAVRFLSCEPLLGPVDLNRWIEPTLHCGSCGTEYGLAEAIPDPNGHIHGADVCAHCGDVGSMTSTWGEDALRQREAGRDLDLGDAWDYGYRLHWVITGGESGPNARPMHPQWARDLRDQCLAARVAYFHKQNGEYVEVDGLRTHAGPVPRDDRGPGTFWLTKEGRLIPFGSPEAYHCSVWGSDVIVKRAGRKIAGRLLDGQEWSQFPEPALAGAAS